MAPPTVSALASFGCGSKPMVPCWGRCTAYFRTYFSGDWNVYWGLTDLDLDPRPFVVSATWMSRPSAEARSAGGPGGPQPPKRSEAKLRAIWEQSLSFSGAGRRDLTSVAHTTHSEPVWPEAKDTLKGRLRELGNQGKLTGNLWGTQGKTYGKPRRTQGTPFFPPS